MHVSAETLMQLLVWIGNETLQAGLLVAVIWLLLMAFGRVMTPGWRHAMWLVLILRLLCPRLPASRFSLYQLLPQIKFADLQDMLPGAGSILWILIWSVGALGLSIYILGYHWRLRRRVAREQPTRSQLAQDILEACREQLGVKARIRLQLTRHVQVPTLLGCFRPRLLIPRSMASLFSRRRLQHVFMHELAHHRRRDILVRWLATFCQVLHWFNPMVWIAFYLMRSDCELACDRLALSRLESTQPRQYGQTLIRLIEHVSYRHQVAALAAGLAQDRFQLKRRLRTITGFQPFSGVLHNWPALLWILLALSGLTGAQRQTTTSSPSATQTWEAQRVQSYYSLLLEQPGNRYLFDKYYEAWLENDSPEALIEFLKGALEQTPNTANRFLLAFAYERQGRDSEALTLYRQGAAEETATAELLFFKAQAEARQLEFEPAIADLQRLRSGSCSQEMAEKAGKLLGELYIRTHQRDKATALWQELLAQGTDNETLYEDLIELQIKEGLFDEALRISDELIAKTKDPYQAVTRRLRQGDIYQYKADRDKALAVYAQALEDVGQGSWLESQISAQIEQVFERDGDLEGLRDFLTDLVEHHSQRLGLKKRLAQLLVELGQADQALALYQEILQASPGDKAHQKAYVDLLDRAGKRDRAITLLETLCTQYRDDRELLLSLADLYHQAKKTEQVVAVLKRFLEASEETEYTFLRVASLFERYDLTEQAHAVYKQMLTALPESLSAAQAHAEFLYMQGRTAEALVLFKRVIAEGDVPTLIRASNAAGTRGHYDRALAWAEARYDEFSERGPYLNHLCKLAMRLEQFDKAVVWARRQLHLADTYPTMRVALTQVLAAVGSDKTTQKLIQELQSLATRSIQQICLLSELYELDNQPYEADALLEQASPAHPELALRQRIHLQRLRLDWAGAAASMVLLIEESGKREISLIRELVDLYEKCHQHEAALKWLRVWQEITPNSAAPRLRQAQLLGSQGRHDQALALLDGAQREFEDNPEVLTQLADLYSATGQHEEAQRVYWRAYQVAQNATDKLRCMGRLAEVAGKRGQYQGLIDKLKREQQRERQSAVPLLALAEVYKQMGSYEERRAALLAASRIQTEDVALLFELARLEEAQGDWEKAIATLQKIVALEPGGEARLKLARLCIQHGDQEDGLRILSDLAGGDKIQPQDAESIAATILSMGRWELAARFLQGLLSSHRKAYKLHYQYAVALEEAGRFQEAREAFVDLLGFQEGIDDSQVHPPELVWKRQGVDTRLQQILPAAAVDILRISQAYNKATRYQRERERAQQRAQRNRSGPLVVNVPLPTTRRDLQLFSLSHLLGLAPDLDAAQKAQLGFDLFRHGIPHAGLLLDISMGRQGWKNLNSTIDGMAVNYADNQAIQAIWILHRIEGRGCTLPEAQHIFHLFESSHPRLALVVGLRCYGKDPTASRLFTRSLEMLRQVPDPGYYEAMAIAVTLQQKNTPVGLTTAQRLLLNDYLLEWYTHLNTTGPNRNTIFNYVASLLRQRSNLSAYVKLLDDEIANYTAPLSSSRSASPSRRLIGAPSYPPDKLPDFPERVLKSLLQGIKPRTQSPFRRPMGLQVQLGQYLDEARDPVLQILLAMVSDQPKEAGILIKRLLVEKPTSVTAYFLGASLAVRLGQYQEVIAHLDKARSLPMSARDRTLIDGALVASALKLNSQRYPQERDIGKNAAIRLMSRALDPWQREELIVAAKGFGLSEQVRNLQRQTAGPVATGSGTTGRRMPSYVRGRGTDIIKEYFNKGQTESALRLCIDSLRSDAANSLRPDFRRYPSNSTQSLLDFIQKKHLTEKLVKQADPGPQASALRLAEYGRICELLKRPDQAEAAYKRAISRQPQEPAAHVNRILLLAERDPTRITEALLEVDPRCLGQVGSGLEANIRDSMARRDFTKAMDLVESVTDYLTRVPNPDALDLGWVDRVAKVSSDSYYSKSHPLVPLYQPQQMPMYHNAGQSGSFSFQTTWSMAPGQSRPIIRHQRSPGLKTVRTNSALSQRRREVHNRLCRTMLEIPQLTEKGFARLAAEAQARGALTENFTQMARRALLTSSAPSPSRSATRSSPSGLAPVNRTPLFKPRCPAEFLVEQAHQAGSLMELVAEFVPELERKGQTEQAQRLKNFADLYGSMPPMPSPVWSQMSGQNRGMPLLTPSQVSTPRTRDPNRIRLRHEISRLRRNRRRRTSP